MNQPDDSVPRRAEPTAPRDPIFPPALAAAVLVFFLIIGSIVWHTASKESKAAARTAELEEEAVRAGRSADAARSHAEEAGERKKIVAEWKAVDDLPFIREEKEIDELYWAEYRSRGESLTLKATRDAQMDRVKAKRDARYRQYQNYIRTGSLSDP